MRTMRCWLILNQFLISFILIKRIQCSDLHLYESKLSIDKQYLTENYQHELEHRQIIPSYQQLHSVFTDDLVYQVADNLNTIVKNSSENKLDLHISEQCLNDTLAIRDGFKERKEWAIRIVDSTAKVPAGILDGNYLWLGNFDECIKKYADITGNKEETGVVDGQYCYSGMSSHLLENFTMTGEALLVTGFCIPTTCSESEANTLMINYLKTHERINKTLDLDLLETACVEPNIPLDTGAIVFLCFLCFYGTIIFLGTLYDIILLQIPKVHHYNQNGNGVVKNDQNSERIPLFDKKCQDSQNNDIPAKPRGCFVRILLCFSVYSNLKKMLNLHQSSENFTAINGIRFLSIAWVILGHTHFFGLAVMENAQYRFPFLSQRLIHQAVFIGTLAVDTFFAMSGCLLAYFTTKELKRKKGKLNWFNFYFHRYWRLTPTYFFVLAFVIVMSKYLGTGPVWPKEGFEYAECEKSWWYNIFYINNFVGNIDEVCMGWSWYLANDMQFYIISPLFLVPIIFSEYIPVVLMLIGILASWVTTAVITYEGEYQPSSLSLDFGGSTFVQVYIKPYCRIGPYLAGMLTGYIMYKTNCTCKIKKIVKLGCWILAAGLGFTALFCLHWKNKTFEPLSVPQSAAYHATFRTIWGVSISWLIFACVTGNAGFINKFLSWKPFIFLSRLTYSAYLIHPVVMYTYFYSIRGPMFYTDFHWVVLYFSQLTMSLMAALVLSLIVEAPILNLEKVLFHKQLKKK